MDDAPDDLRAGDKGHEIQATVPCSARYAPCLGRAWIAPRVYVLMQPESFAGESDRWYRVGEVSCKGMCIETPLARVDSGQAPSRAGGDVQVRVESDIARPETNILRETGNGHDSLSGNETVFWAAQQQPRRRESNPQI